MGPLMPTRLGAAIARVSMFGLAVSTLFGCGGGNAGLLRGAARTETVTAPEPAANRYQTIDTETAVVGPGAADVEQGILSAAEERSVEMHGDGRLGTLAAWTADHLGEGGAPPPHSVVEFFSRHLGLVEPVPHLLILGQPDPSLLTAGITDSVSQFLARQPYNRYGAAIVERQGLTLAVVTLSWRWLSLDPIPKRVVTGQPISIRGSLQGSYRDPTLAVADPQGHVTRMPSGEGPEFEVSVPTEESGVYKIEVLARGPRGDTVVANFPLYVGVDVPDSVRVVGDESAESETRDPNQVAESLFRLVNRSRREANLAPLLAHGGLAEIARGHSADMVDSGFVGHDSPTTGTAAQRVERGGFRSGLVLENIGRGYSASEIHEGLLQSPGHRANILSDQVTHVGVGVIGEPEGARMAFVATQVFINIAPEIDVGTAPDRVVEAINRARSVRRRPRLSMESSLSEAAQEAAEAFFDNPRLSQERAVHRATEAVEHLGIAFSRIGGVMVVVTNLEDAFALEHTFDAEARHVGVGVAQGSRPDTPSNALAVVILLAYPR